MVSSTERSRTTSPIKVVCRVTVTGTSRARTGPNTTPRGLIGGAGLADGSGAGRSGGGGAESSGERGSAGRTASLGEPMATSIPVRPTAWARLS